MEKIKKVNWFAVINDFVQSGVSVRELSRRIDVHESTIRGWKDSRTSPKYDEGVKLVDAWRSEMQKNSDQLPCV
jgi:transposase